MGLGERAREDFLLVPPTEPYAISKALADRAVQRMIAEESLPATIIRPAESLGPGDYRHFARIASWLQAGQAFIIGPGHNAVPFVFVTDVVLGMLLCLDRDAAVGQAFNITTNEPLTQAGLLEAIAQEIGASPPRVRLPYPLAYAMGYAGDQISTLTRGRWHMAITRPEVTLYGTDNRQTIDKAARQLGFRPSVDLRDGIQFTAAWYREAARGPSPSTPSGRSALRAPRA
jgi:nucleoside-diphosphate-sugar epimerase